ncbi:MAG: hypothetical protein ACRD6X_01330 [Pyrinomonadaceae bacterium]
MTFAGETFKGSTLDRTTRAVSRDPQEAFRWSQIASRKSQVVFRTPQSRVRVLQLEYRCLLVVSQTSQVE